MVIECSSCHARFKLSDDKVKESGTKVRCTKCREVFTVFPESPPPIVVEPTPAVPVAPAVTPQTEVALFSGTDTTSFVAEMPPPAADVPVSDEEDWDQDWNQKGAANFLPDGFPDDAGASDLDAISFDNIEAPVFSVSSETESKFEFTDETAFSFTDLTLESGTEQPHKIAETTGEPSLSAESDNDFEADYSSFAPSIPSSENLSQLNAVATEGEFTFSGADNLDDFSWDEPTATPIATTVPAEIRETGAKSQDTAFDFSSFSFDDDASSVTADENKSDETVARSAATIELPMETEMPLTHVVTRPLPTEAPPAPLVRDRQESTRPARPMRPRVRPKKKVSSRLAVKVILLILLALATIYGIINRNQIQKASKNIVNSFIENQTQVETSGRIDLVKLSGSYVVNSREGDLFVIRGEAVNEFKGLRSSILVRGTIYGDNGAVLQSQSAYCGNPLRDSSLKNSSFKEIRDIMNNELGENLVNLNIATGKGVPFTIVFNKAPKNIKEFAVEVIESKPGSK